MSDRMIRIPGPEHPISIAPNPSRIVVRVGGKVVADTRQALTLLEARYPPVQYIPRADVDMSLLERTPTSSYCPYKGEAAYFSVPAGGERSRDAVWTYEDAFPACAAIEGHLAFYPDRVESIEALDA